MVTSARVPGRRPGVPRVALAAWLAASAVSLTACGPLGRNTQDDAHNSRMTGSWLSLGRAQGADGSLVVHVAASHPEHVEDIAHKIVRQNYATAAVPIRIVIDPMVGEAERRVYRWDGRSLAADASQEGLPPRAHRPDADGGEAAPH